LDGIYADCFAEELDRLQRQVALATLDATHVGSMDANDVGKLLLAQPTGLTASAQVGAKHALQITRSHSTSFVECYS